MKNKNIVVIYNGEDWKREVPLISTPTRESFQDFHIRGLKKKVYVYRANIDWYDIGRNIFRKAWAYRKGKWIKINKPVKPDLIFDKTEGKLNYELFDLKMDISKKVRLLNHPLFRMIIDNKFTQYIFMKEFMAPSYLIANKEELPGILAKIKSVKAVVKPLHGSGGAGIIIKEKRKVKPKDIKFPVLVQEFVKSEKGIPGLSRKKEVSDLRMIFLNGKFIYALSRVAKKGSLFTNFHKGASVFPVKKSQIPKSAWNMAYKIVAKLRDFQKTNYSLDFIFNNNSEPILVEINTTPGFDLLQIVGNEKIKNIHLDEFIKILKG